MTRLPQVKVIAVQLHSGGFSAMKPSMRLGNVWELTLECGCKVKRPCRYAPSEKNKRRGWYNRRDAEDVLPPPKLVTHVCPPKTKKPVQPVLPKMVLDGRAVYLWNEDHTHAFHRLLELPRMESNFYPGIVHSDFSGYWSEFTAQHFRTIEGKRIRVTIEVVEDEAKQGETKGLENAPSDT